LSSQLRSWAVIPLDAHLMQACERPRAGPDYEQKRKIMSLSELSTYAAHSSDHTEPKHHCLSNSTVTVHQLPTHTALSDVSETVPNDLFVNTVSRVYNTI
jgi:hypothetical protein